VRRPASSRQALRLAVSDAVAILIFVTIGLLSHHGGVSLRGYARDALPFLAGWYAAAFAFRLYSRPGLWRLGATWAVGVPLGVLIRALALGRSLDGKEAAFLAVSLVTIGVLVAALRGLLALVSRR
jgi:4-amino-4-deoxy-L-arabinose transferase-like glycosyltransferase